jgi:CheY-like chemotaxis protein
MDIQIPEIDGKEATRTIRKAGFTKPIVALTAHALIEERRSCLEAGCNGQITKPVSGENLVSEVASYLSQNLGRIHGSAVIHPG